MKFNCDKYTRLNNELITSIKNTLKIDNIKNDYSVWGNRKTDSGQDEKVHARYAIDIKPRFYKSYNDEYYIANNDDIIYAQKDLKGNILNSFTPMIEVGTIGELEFKSGIYYRANLQYYLMPSSNKYIVNN
jgi:hypothetical protein